MIDKHGDNDQVNKARIGKARKFVSEHLDKRIRFRAKLRIFNSNVKSAHALLLSDNKDHAAEDPVRTSRARTSDPTEVEVGLNGAHPQETSIQEHKTGLSPRIRRKGGRKFGSSSTGGEKQRLGSGESRGAEERAINRTECAGVGSSLAYALHWAMGLSKL